MALGRKKLVKVMHTFRDTDNFSLQRRDVFPRLEVLDAGHGSAATEKGVFTYA